MTIKERRAVEWCIRELEGLHQWLADCDVPNLASKVAGVKSTLGVLKKASEGPKVRRSYATR